MKQKPVFRIALCMIFLITCFSNILNAQTQTDLVEGNLIQFNDNGAWCWYQDERVIVDTIQGNLILGSDASGSGTGGSTRNGRIESVICNLNTGQMVRYTLMNTGCDDHNTPAFLIRPDGKYVAMYAEHYDYYNSRYRIFDSEDWTAEKRFDWQTIPGGTNYTIAYSNLYYLSAEGFIYNFARANNRSPNFIYSTDLGENWSFGGQLSTNNTQSYNKGYYKYWSNGIDRIDFILTEEHPRDGLTSMYHGYIENGRTHDTYGNVVDDKVFDADSLPTFENFTRIFADSTVIDGHAMRKIWNADLMRYGEGTIAAILTCRIDEATNGNDTSIDPDHAFIYCRFDGISWSYTYLGRAGRKMYASEADYTGLGALHPNDPNTIYISTHIDPLTDQDITNREIYRGETEDQGKSWFWIAVTRNSNEDNFRPVVPQWKNGKTALLWFRGSYNSAQSFDAAVVGLIDRGNERPEPMEYLDADPVNTNYDDGSPLATTGPDANRGPGDDLWHWRTGFGNGGSVLTSSEIDGEDAPALKTQFRIPTDGVYDIWVNFWANPDEDWRIRAGMSLSGMRIFRRMAGKQVEQGDHKDDLVLTGGGNTFLYQAYVGRIKAEAGDTAGVCIDDYAIQTGSANTPIGSYARTWYDGLSYAQVESTTVNTASMPARNPAGFLLMQNYPNPFNPATEISWQLAVAGHMDLSVYDLLGRKVATLVSRKMEAGRHTYRFDGSGQASGVYYYQLSAGNHREVRKMVLLR